MLGAPTTRKATITGQAGPLIRNRARLRQASKAALDYLLVVPTLLLLLPLFLIIAVLIKLESPGPIFHRRRVIGLRGSFFEAYKFRTMYVDGDARLINNREKWVSLLNNDPQTGDPRVTRVGAYLQRFGLQDLPRLFNILNRQMSLVGPHLLNQQEVARLGVQRVQMLTSVKPGLTGLWQVHSFCRSQADCQKMELDYINNWSIRADLHILLDTFVVVRAGSTE
jgi:lipopolysaccharide/colanic/teichoic acid biosynthesis glycosyltransferase